jgi:anti-sigma B factor antagonist
VYLRLPEIPAVPYNLDSMSESLVIDRSDSFPLQEVLTLSGPLTASNCPVFENALRREEPSPTLILDLSDVPYVDSAGLGLLVSAYVSRQKTGRTMVLTGINPRVQKLFEITRVAGLFLTFSDPGEAIAALGSAAQA